MQHFFLCKWNWFVNIYHSIFIKHKKILNWKWEKLSFNKNGKSWFTTCYVKVLSRYSCHVNFRQSFLNIFLKITNFWNKLLWSFCIFVSGFHVVGDITMAHMADEKRCKIFMKVTCSSSAFLISKNVKLYFLLTWVFFFLLFYCCLNVYWKI